MAHAPFHRTSDGANALQRMETIMKIQSVFPMPQALLAALAVLPDDHRGTITLAEARVWANDAHAEVGQTYGDRPYSFHLDDVENSAIHWGFGDDEELRILCRTHDVFEDTDKTFVEMLEAGFSASSVVLAWRLTDEGEKDDSRAVKKHKTLPKISEDWRAVLGKLCDRRANGLRSRVERPDKFARYCQEYAEFREELRDPDDARVAHCWAELDEIFGYVG